MARKKRKLTKAPKEHRTRRRQVDNKDSDALVESCSNVVTEQLQDEQPSKSVQQVASSDSLGYPPVGLTDQPREQSSGFIEQVTSSDSQGHPAVGVSEQPEKEASKLIHQAAASSSSQADHANQLNKGTLRQTSQEDPSKSPIFETLTQTARRRPRQVYVTCDQTNQQISASVSQLANIDSSASNVLSLSGDDIIILPLSGDVSDAMIVSDAQPHCAVPRALPLFPAMDRYHADKDSKSSAENQWELHQDEEKEYIGYSLLSKVLQHCCSDLPAEWLASVQSDKLRLFKVSDKLNPVIQCSVGLQSDGTCVVEVHRLKLADNHSIKKLLDFEPSSMSTENIPAISFKLLKILEMMDKYTVCPGSNAAAHKDFWEQSDTYFVEGDYHEKQYDSTCRSINCDLLVTKHRCTHCSILSKAFAKRLHRKKKVSSEVIEKAGVSRQRDSSMDSVQLKKKLKLQAKKIRALSQQTRRLVQRIHALITEQGVEIDSDMSADFKNIINIEKDRLSPLQSLFWEQQLQVLKLKTKKSLRWHPMMVRLALAIKEKSVGAYEVLRSSGIITLPCLQTLYDYSHYFDVKEGVQYEIIGEIVEKFENFKEEHESYVSLIFDEMNIKQDLVFSKYTGKPVGYINLSNVEKEWEMLDAKLNSSAMEEKKQVLAKKVLALMANGITTNVQDIVVFFSVGNLTHLQLHTRVWEVIYALEKERIKVLCVIGDGASVNRKFFNMEDSENSGVVYKVRNRAAVEERFLYFISDPSHLIKTARNCASNSGAHSKSRSLWIRGRPILWRFWINLHKLEKRLKWKKVPKLSASHVFLTSFARMKVSLAVQALSNTVAEAFTYYKNVENLKEFEDSEEAILFVRMFDALFDIFNGSASVDSDSSYQKKNLKPFKSATDSRFDWLKTVFLKYLKDWEDSVHARQGKWTRKQQRRMMLSQQTRDGLQITINSFVEIVTFLLNSGAPFVYARKLSQDPIEHYFSKQRAKGGSWDNPNLKQFAHNVASLHVQSSSALGSKRGNTKVQQGNIVVDHTPLRKRKKTQAPTSF